MKLPASAQEIADVIGRDRALYLIGKLPKTYPPSTRSSNGATERVIMYVPKTLKPDHSLVNILGWDDAAKLVRFFGGEILCPANCKEIYRRFRDRSIAEMLNDGQLPEFIAELMSVSKKTVANIAKEFAQEEARGV